MEERWRVRATAKAQAKEAKACQIEEEKVVVVTAARHRSVLAETAAEEAGMEPDGGSLSKQKGWAEGEQTACDHCATWGFECQVGQM